MDLDGPTDTARRAAGACPPAAATHRGDTPHAPRRRAAVTPTATATARRRQTLSSDL